jgi:spore coat polysaccharide biosynthesis protein SpsF (cytidylyltransferase family)
VIAGAIVQARTGSHRLPGKVLADVCGAPLLHRVVQRVAEARTLGRIVIATTSKPEDDAIAEFCVEHDLACFRGAEDDVLSRVTRAALAFEIDPVVRITADCPFVCPGAIDDLVSALRSADADYATYDVATVHEGIDPFRLRYLARANALCLPSDEREHLALLVRRNRANVRVVRAKATDGFAAREGLRLSIDEPADLAFARAVVALLGRDFTTRDLLALLDARPTLLAMNRHVARVVPVGVHA